jgi:hypothetical protein
MIRELSYALSGDGMGDWDVLSPDGRSQDLEADDFDFGGDKPSVVIWRA